MPTTPSYDEIANVVSEGFHTALRKVGESAQSTAIRREIDAMSDDEWRRVVEFALVGLFDLLGVEVPGDE